MATDTLIASGSEKMWDVATNWSAGVPTSSSDVVITANSSYNGVGIAATDPAYTVASLAISAYTFLDVYGSLAVTGATNVAAGFVGLYGRGLVTLSGSTTLGPGGFLDLNASGATLNVTTLNGVGVGGTSGDQVKIYAGLANIGAATGPTLLILEGGALSVGSTAGSDQFLLEGGKLTLGTTDPVINDGLQFDATIPVDLTGLSYQPGETASIVRSGTTTNIVVKSASGQTLLTFAKVYGGSSSSPLAVSSPMSDGAGGTLITIACYTADTAILTPGGDVAAGELREGDLVTKADGRVAPVIWIGRRSYAGRFLAGQRHLLPIRIAAGALADGVPRRDLLVSPCHAMLIDGVLIAAGDLVNGSSIVQERALERVDYVHIELAQHDIILAEGAPSETFVDDGGRGAFENAAGWLAANPDIAAHPVYCAPRLTDGPALEAVRHRLAERAGPVRRAA